MGLAWSLVIRTAFHRTAIGGFSDDSCRSNFPLTRQLCGQSAVPRDTNHMDSLLQDTSLTWAVSCCSPDFGLRAERLGQELAWRVEGAPRGWEVC